MYKEQFNKMLQLLRTTIGNLRTKVQDSFRLAWRGEEQEWIVLFLWGGLAILVNFIIVNPMVRAIRFNFIDLIIHLLVIVYFVTHLMMISRLPSVPEIETEATPPADKKARLERRKQQGKDLMQKMLLQKSWSQWSWTKVVVLVELYIILTHFAKIFI